MAVWHLSQVPELHLCCLCLVHTALLRATTEIRATFSHHILKSCRQPLTEKVAVGQHQLPLCTWNSSSPCKYLKLKKAANSSGKCYFSCITAAGFDLNRYGLRPLHMFALCSVAWIYADIWDYWSVYVQIPVAPVTVVLLHTWISLILRTQSLKPLIPTYVFTSSQERGSPVQFLI